MIITGELGKLKTHSPIYWIKDNWENCLNRRHTLGSIYLTNILVVQCLQIGLHNDDNEIDWSPKKDTRSQYSRDIYVIDDRIWYNHLRHHTMEKYDSNGKGGYFRVDDDNKMGYEYIRSTTYTRMSQFNTCNPIYARGNRKKLSHLRHTRDMIYPTGIFVLKKVIHCCRLQNGDYFARGSIW